MKLVTVECLESLGELAGARREDRRAAVLWGSAESQRESLETPMNPEEIAEFEYLWTARSRLGEAAWEEALAEGRSMTLEQAVAYALGEGTEREG